MHGVGRSLIVGANSVAHQLPSICKGLRVQGAVNFSNMYKEIEGLGGIFSNIVD